MPVVIAYIDFGQYQQAEDIAATISWSQKSPYILARIADKYAESQQFDKAREFAEWIQDSGAKASAFANIAKRYAEAGRFDDAMRIVDALGDSYFKDESLTGIAAAHAQAGHYDLAIQVATSIQGAGKASAFTKIATDSMKAGELPPTLLPTVNRIEDPFQKSAALGEIGYELAKTGRVDEGLQIVRTIGGPEGRANHLYRIARLYSDAKKFDEAVGILGEVEGLANNIEDPNSRADRLVSLAESYARAGRFDRATQIAATIDKPYFKTSALQAIAERYQLAGQMDKAIAVLSEAVHTIKAVKAGRDYTAPRDSAENRLGVIATSLAFNNQFALALYACQSLESMSDKVNILGDIGAKYAKSGQKLDGAARKILHDIIGANQ